MSLQQIITSMVIKMYNNLNHSREDVQQIVIDFINYTKAYNSFMKKDLLDNLEGEISAQGKLILTNVFAKHEDPFSQFNSDKKRLRFFQNAGLYKEPEFRIVHVRLVEKIKGDQAIIKSVPTTVVHIPLEHSIRKLFKIDNLFNATLKYMKSLKEDTGAVSNFVQAQLWKQQTENLPKDEVYLPVFTFFDDLEVGNPLGPKAGKNKIGCMYATIPCIPPSFSSKLDNIMVTDLFYSETRKGFNREVFQKLIAELIHLRNNGITIIVDNKPVKVKFIISLILGDNLGINAILGLVESFSKTHFCRICLASAEDVKILLKEDESLLRTKEEYDEMIKNITGEITLETGIKEQCTFNDLADFHIIENSSVDVMHDLFEGVANYVLAEVLLYFVCEAGLFNIDFVNKRLNILKFKGESNIPSAIDIEYVRKNRRLKMSASETLFFARYFGIIVGDKIPRDDAYDHWKAYIKLREMIDIITDPVITKSNLLQLEELITEHHRIYHRLFSHLKAKFHLLLHYIRMMLRNGPLVNHSGMRFEAFHRRMKKIILSTSSRRNIIMTIAIRYLLYQMNVPYIKYQDCVINYGSKIKVDSENSLQCFYEHIEINDVNFEEGTVIVTGLGTHPQFGIVKQVYSKSDRIYFSYQPMQYIGLDKHYWAHSVEYDKNSNLKEIAYEDLPTTVLCLFFEKSNTKYVTTRYSL